MASPQTIASSPPTDVRPAKCQVPAVESVLLWLLNAGDDAEYVDPPLSETVSECCDDCRSVALKEWVAVIAQLRESITNVQTVNGNARTPKIPRIVREDKMLYHNQQIIPLFWLLETPI